MLRSHGSSHRPPRGVLPFVVAACTMPLAVCQEEHFRVLGEEKWALAAVRPIGGDLNGDGVGDLVVGGDAGGPWGGVVLVVSGVDGTPIFPPIGGPWDYGFGYFVSGVGDFDGDGVADFATGVPDDGGGFTGEVRVFSGATAAELARILGPTGYSNAFGVHVDPLGDLDGDGFAEFAATALYSGEVWIYGGPDAHVFRVHPEPPYGQPPVVATLGDVDGDGVPEYVVGRDGGTGGTHGEVIVCSGASGATLIHLTGKRAGHHGFGSGVAPMGDLDGDGVQDFAASSDEVYGCTPDLDLGAVQFFSGADGSLIGTIEDSRVPYLWAGCSFFDLHGGADVNGDGVFDLVTTSPWARYMDQGKWNEKGFAAVYSGATGTMLWRRAPNNSRMAMVGDLDGDGLSEWALGWLYDDEGGWGAGKVTVYKGFPGDAQRVCTSTPNSTGNAARLSLEGPISISNNELHLAVDGAVPHQRGMFFYGSTLTQVPFGDGVLCAGSGMPGLYAIGGIVTLDDAGSILKHVDVQDDPHWVGPGHFAPPSWEPGSTFVLQFLYLDPAAGGAGFNLSDAMQVTFTS